jgi:PAS domain S-box-containing protein
LLRHFQFAVVTAFTSTSTEPDLHDALQYSLLRAFFAIAALVTTLGLVVAVFSGQGLTPQAHWLRVGVNAVLALGFGLCLRLPRVRSLRILAPLVLVSPVLMAVQGLATGWGLQTPGLVLLSLLVLLANAVGSTRLGWASLLAALAGLLALAIAEQIGWLLAPVGLPPFTSRLVVLCAGIAAGALMGRGLARVLRQHLRAADAREQRFRALLGIATSAYWETDAELRLSQLFGRNETGQFVPMVSVLGQLPWNIAALSFDGDNLDLLRAEMEARVALRDLAFHWRRADGQTQHCLASGEPRFDTDGRFTGYWGVARDVTGEHLAHQALVRTESRYRDLFKRIPTPLLLHQQGVVIDANPAAAHLLDYDTVDQMLGRPLVTDHVVPAQRAAVLARLSQIEALPLGQAVPPLDLHLITRSGRQRVVSSVGTRADFGGHAAVLSIAFDETDRRIASDALLRTQALLSRVVSLNPDVITLADLHSGRFVMVNNSFCRLLGYSRTQVEGRTSQELGLWRDPADRAALLQAIADDGAAQDRLIRFKTRGGQDLPLLMSGIRFDSDGASYLLLNGRDMSETHRVRLEREAMLANASVGIAFTRDRRFVLVNPQMEAMYGWAPGTLTGQPAGVIWADEADYAALGQAVGPALARGEAIDIERPVQRQDGSPFVVRLRGKAIDLQNPTTSGTIWIVEDVTLARRAEKDLERARDAAEAASRAKSAFLANTSHEIRTPLSGVLGLARLARVPGLAPERLRLYLDQISESAELLAATLTDILDVAKIEAGKLHLEAAPFDLQALLRTLQQTYAALAASQGLAFDAQLDPLLPVWVRGDVLRLRQIAANYLNNALKFTPSGGIRLVALARAGGGLRLEVHDTGPGIDAAVQLRLFQPFTQADESTTRRYGGSGLGLSICRELALLMGGSVGLSSRVGQGSCFYADLPLKPWRGGAAVLLPDGRAASPLQGARVLLVEDNSVNMLIGVALLEQWGAAVTEAGDGLQALAAVAQAATEGWRFDAVLMDLQMPGMSGFEATLALRTRYSAEQLPVIALTAAALVSERERAAAIGMNDFVTKPIDPLRLRAVLLRVLGSPQDTTPSPLV